MDNQRDEAHEEKVIRVIDQLQQEWKNCNRLHLRTRYAHKEGIRSSQISALIGFLIRKGIL